MTTLKDLHNLPRPIRLPRAEQIKAGFGEGSPWYWMNRILGDSTSAPRRVFCVAFRDKARSLGVPETEQVMAMISMRLRTGDKILACMVAGFEALGYRPMTPAQVREGRRKK